MKIDPIFKPLVSNAGRNGLITLMYHAVRPGAESPDWPWAVSFRAFCEQMDYLLAQGWNTICAREIEAGKIFPPRTLCITFDDGYADNYSAFEALSKRGMRASWFIVSREVGGRSNWPGESIPPQPMLSAEQLRDIEAAGMEICSHTVSHCRLTRADEATVEYELSDSRKRLSDLLCRDITTFAYPYGLYDTRIVNATRYAGYRVALTAETGFGMIDNDTLRVRRITVFNTDNLSTFSRKLAFGLYDVSCKAIVKYFQRRARQRIHSIISP